MDLSPGFSPQALSVYLYLNNIPSDRHTENRAEFSVVSANSIYRNYLNLLSNFTKSSDVHTIYLSVRCGLQPKRFKILGDYVVSTPSNCALFFSFSDIPRQLTKIPNGDAIRGEVCLSAWIYHSIVIPENFDKNSTLDVSGIAYSDAIEFVVKAGSPVNLLLNSFCLCCFFKNFKIKFLFYFLQIHPNTAVSNRPAL